VLVLPTVPFTAPPRDVETIRIADADEAVNAALGRCTMPFSFLGAPALSVPMRERDHDGMPIGVQLVGRPGADGLLLELAAELEADGVAAAQIARG
jgi:aspartyl-tRNA(Asn)/glutamyl-tRNA(Gln) amidotransferase subunit A